MFTFKISNKGTRPRHELTTPIARYLTNNFDVNSTHTQGILCIGISDCDVFFHIGKMGKAQRIEA